MTVRRRPESETLKKWREKVNEIVSGCWCDEAYVGRGLAQPDCAWCEHAEEVAELLEAIARLRAEIKDIQAAMDNIYFLSDLVITEGQNMAGVPDDIPWPPPPLLAIYNTAKRYAKALAEE